ncbi:MAG: hypothetical protein IPO92_17020 [Saprospiraceae bacterium]|nr:hypothetical protein [Saprospiraceae bacterium]
MNSIIQVNVDTINYLWMGPGLLSSQPSPSITSSGQYMVTVTSGLNGCTASTFINIEKDTLIPIVALSVDSISCTVDTVIIRLTSSRPPESAIWSGPNLFTSFDLEPKVSREGHLYYYFQR